MNAVILRRTFCQRAPLKTARGALLLMFALAYAASADEKLTGELRVRVVDAESQQPMVARLVLQAADGAYPGDRIGLARDKWPHLEAHGVFVDREASFTLPAGKTRVQASCGPQYEVSGKDIRVIAGEATEIELRIKRRIDMRKLGWVCGDAHLHMIHGEMQRATSYADVALTCQANGLDWAYVNQEYSGAGENSLQAFHAECKKVSRDRFQLLLGGERPKSLLGHNALIGVTNPFVVPDDPPYYQAAAAVHAQGGVLFPVHPVRYFPGKKYLEQWLDFPGNNLGREIVFDAFLGPSFDGLSVLSDEPDDRRAHQLWFNLLNKGLFVPALADSDACFDRPTLQRSVPGFWATYVYVGPEGAVDSRSLSAAVRAGRTMATTGPLLMWDIDGHRSGATITPDGKERQVHIDVQHFHHNWTLDEARVSKVELLRNGEVIRVWEPNMPEAKLSLSISEKEECWYAVRAFGTDPRWQVAVASPIYFAPQPAATKKKPLTVRVRGRAYDFISGKESQATITVRRDEQMLKRFETDGQFAVDMPLDATIEATNGKHEAVRHDLLLGYGPVHQFLWRLDGEALAKPETLDKFESLVRNIDLEFPLGYCMPGCYASRKLDDDVSFESVRVTASPKPSSPGAVAVAAILLNKRQAKSGDTIQIAVLFHDQGQPTSSDALLVAEGRAYDPCRPTGFNPLKVFGTFESKWSRAKDSGNGYRMITGALQVPEWVDRGGLDAIEINAFARGQGGRYESHVGLRIPLGETSRELMVVCNWPTIPVSWPDHNYGIGPLKVCGKIGRQGQPHTDYRLLMMAVQTSRGIVEISPANDCRGCADADDAVYGGHYYDQVLNDETRLLPIHEPRSQPEITWRKLEVIDATTTAIDGNEND